MYINFYNKANDKMETLSDRLKKFIESSEYKKIRAFERYMGWGNSTVNNLKNSINTDKMMELKEKVPYLNLGWLINGKTTEIYTVFKKKRELEELKNLSMKKIRDFK